MTSPPQDPGNAEPQIIPLHHNTNGVPSPTQTRDQRERENLYASIQSTNSWRRQPVDLDGSGAPAGPNGFYSKNAPHATSSQSVGVGGVEMTAGKSTSKAGTAEVSHVRPRDTRDAPNGAPQGPATPLAISRPQSPFTQHPTIDFDGLSWPSLGTRERKEETEQQRSNRLEKLSGAVRTILECVGEDPDREGILETPERYAKAMLFFTKGYEENLRDIVNGAVFHEDHDELVIVKDIEIFSLCEHHLVPFTGKMHIGYIPNRRVLGLSKIARIAEMFARRLQLQERLTKQVALALSEVLQPQGVAVVMESSHLCMVMRGVQKTGSSTVTSCMLGRMRSTAKTRQEFMTLLNRH